jgi:hypothetical protein
VPKASRAYLETGQRWVFACALDWPGWCRRGQGEEAAIEALLDYSSRYAAVAGPRFEGGEIEIVGRVAGNPTTDFGAPSAIGPWDAEPFHVAEAQSQIALLEAAWEALDRVVERAPAELRKGPRGGGRDRDAIADHVREAERAYASKIGLKVPPRTPWDEQRTALVAALRAAGPETKWPARYALRRIAWHILDHVWEIEDKSA